MLTSVLCRSGGETDRQTEVSWPLGILPLEGYFGTSYTHRTCLVSSSSRRSTVLARESSWVIPELQYVLSEIFIVITVESNAPIRNNTRKFCDFPQSLQVLTFCKLCVILQPGCNPPTLLHCQSFICVFVNVWMHSTQFYLCASTIHHLTWMAQSRLHLCVYTHMYTPHSSIIYYYYLHIHHHNPKTK